MNIELIQTLNVFIMNMNVNIHTASGAYKRKIKKIKEEAGSLYFEKVC